MLNMTDEASILLLISHWKVTAKIQRMTKMPETLNFIIALPFRTVRTGIKRERWPKGKLWAKIL